MDAHNLDRAAEFCKLVDAADLLAYLQVPADVPPEEARNKLKARRKYMQGMQGNPKYKREALYLIKHFAALDAVLLDPPTYLADAMRRAESIHLPILEMTVRGVLAAGGLTASQQDYLRRNATELGVTEATFEELLERLAREAGVQRPGRAAAPPRPRSSNAPTVILDHLPPAPTGDFYRFLGVSSSARDEDVHAAYQRKLATVDAMPPGIEQDEARVRLSLVWSVLSDREARAQYDISSTRTGPPARNREVGPQTDDVAPSAKTAPLGLGPRLEVDSDPEVVIRAGTGPAKHTIVVRNTGDQPMSGRVETTALWLRASPSMLDPDLPQQEIELVVERDRLGDGEPRAQVRIVTDGAGDASVAVVVGRTAGPRIWIAAGVTALLAVLTVLSVALVLVVSGDGPSLIVQVDPVAERVTLGGRQVGAGTRVTVPDPPLGKVELDVAQPGFEPWSRQVEVDGSSSQVIEVILKPTRRLDFVPQEKDRRGSLPPEVAQATVDRHRDGIDRCLRLGLAPGQTAKGTLRVHVGPTGAAKGLQVEGSAQTGKDAMDCLERQATTMSFAPLTDGDYATVKYAYQVIGETAAR